MRFNTINFSGIIWKFTVSILISPMCTLYHCLIFIPTSNVPQFSLPTPCTDEDANMLLCMKYQKSTALRIFKSTIVTKQFLNTCLDVFGALIQEKADKVHIRTCIKFNI